MTPRRRLVAALAIAAALLAGGCSSSGPAATDEPVISPVPSESVPPATAAPPSTPPAGSAASSTPAATTASSSAAPPSSSASSSRPPTTVPTVPERSTCTKLSIRAIPGGASMGQEIAALQFTNEGSTRCELVGYPTVTLLRNGATIGRPSQPSSTAPSRRTLEPGEVAESLLHDYVGNCQAPLSDRIRVVAPGSTQSLVRPMQLRACVVRIDKLDAPD